MSSPKTFAVIDIGTIKVKFLVAASQDRQTKTLYESNALTCLGVRMNENHGQPLPENLAKTIAELQRCRTELAKNPVDNIRVVSTHALREMGTTGQQVAAEIEKATGFKVEIISQQEEAQLFFNAVIRDFPPDTDFTVVDVGGGSMQVLIGNQKELKQTYLLHTGAQYLADVYSPRHTGTDHPTRLEIRKMKNYLLEQFAPITPDLKTPLVYGSSCIIDVFKTLGLKIERYRFAKNHPYKVNLSEMETFLQKIIPVPYDRRETMFNFSQKYYMWGIDKAFLNIITLGRKIGSPYIIPSNANINQGLLLAMQK